MQGPSAARDGGELGRPELLIDMFTIFIIRKYHMIICGVGSSLHPDISERSLDQAPIWGEIVLLRGNILVRAMRSDRDVSFGNAGVFRGCLSMRSIEANGELIRGLDAARIQTHDPHPTKAGIARRRE